MVTSTTLEAGSRLGNYVLQELLGRGAFADVWKAAHHERPSGFVAVKIATSPDFRKQLSREGRLPVIDHPNVVPILDADTRFAEVPYVVMRFVEGETLLDLIARNPSGLDEDRVKGLLADILAGLTAAHAKGIIHRDLKPSNILIDEQGRALISDFGLCIENGTPNAHRSIVQSASNSVEKGQSIAGTLAYMAPEVLEGKSPTPAVDVYSVGVILFEMLVGQRPGGIVLPSDAKERLENPNLWNKLFSEACCPSETRHKDAVAMAQAFEETLAQSSTQVSSTLPGNSTPNDTGSKGKRTQDGRHVAANKPAFLSTIGSILSWATVFPIFTLLGWAVIGASGGVSTALVLRYLNQEIYHGSNQEWGNLIMPVLIAGVCGVILGVIVSSVGKHLATTAAFTQTLALCGEVGCLLGMILACFVIGKTSPLLESVFRFCAYTAVTGLYFAVVGGTSRCIYRFSGDRNEIQGPVHGFAFIVGGAFGALTGPDDQTVMRSAVMGASLFVLFQIPILLKGVRQELQG